MQTKYMIVAALVAITLGCHDDVGPDADPIHEPPPIGEETETGEPDDALDPSDSEVETDPWIDELAYALAWPIDDGFQIAGYNAAGEELGWIIVAAPAPELIVSEHRYHRPCEFNEIDCFDSVIVLFDLSGEPTPEVAHTLPMDVAHRRAEALTVLAQEQPQPLNKHLKCALSIAVPLVECGLLGEFNPLGCVGSVVAALCACQETAKKLFPELDLTKLKELCE